MATITTTELAEICETTPRNLRKFLRDDFKSREKGDELPGKGSRYAIEKREVKSLKSRFAKWESAQQEKRDARNSENEEIEESDED